MVTYVRLPLSAHWRVCRSLSLGVAMGTNGLLMNDKYDPLARTMQYFQDVPTKGEATPGAECACATDRK